MRYRLILLLVIAFTSAVCHAQDDSLMNLLNQGQGKKQKEYVSATFKATRIINGSSVENLGAGVLDFRISHRFGQLNQGAQNFFGLDDATTRIGLDYGITKWLMVGIGHSTLYKEDDGFLKIKLLRQTEKGGGMPITVSYVGEMSIQTGTNTAIPSGETYMFGDRLYFANQVLIARKFSDWFSLQLMPTYIHYNLVDSTKYPNNTFAIGVGGRLKFSRRFALTGEYYYVLPGTEQPGHYNSLSLGVDIETGGHVFQLHFTNSAGLTERTYIGQTTDSWAKGQLHFGFNISRVFTIVRPKEFKDSKNKIW